MVLPVSDREDLCVMALHSVISVQPMADGWAVLTPDVEPLVFRSGRKAEEAAKALAARLADLGRAVLVRIHDRSHTLIGTAWYPAAA